MDEREFQSAFSISGLILKARPETEGEERFVYCEPSTEDWDNEGERIPRQALAKAASYFLKFGNLDIGHYTLPGVARMLGIEHPELYEIGRPVEVKTDPAVMVKGAVYRGEGKHVEQANLFWDRLTKQVPPARYYPSVGGRRGPKVRGELIAPIWTNVGFWNEPVNPMVKAVSPVPFGVFGKTLSLISDEEFAKAALAAGHATDVAQLTGGAAPRRESLFGAPLRQTAEGKDAESSYRRAALRFLKGRGAACLHKGGDLSREKLAAHFRECEGLDDATAAKYAERLIRDASRRVRAARAQGSAARAA